ncbi:MAG: 16S rRNA processing protein RimM [Lachnospiraceae bacterium]|jgi:16S rRNA processing protein RimM|nr:16S rRNA processing protein RimM [Lachnospiraceae bacterium]
MEEYLKIGSIISTHALRGEVKVYPTTEDVRRYDILDKVYVDSQTGKECLRVERVRYFRSLVIVKFRGLDRIEDVERLIKKDLLVAREDAIPLGENEYFICDVIGLKAVTDDGRELGEVKDVMETGANDVYIISRKEDPKSELLIPATKEVVLEISPEKGVMLVHMLPGLED